jgi:hypothetical protein
LRLRLVAFFFVAFFLAFFLRAAIASVSFHGGSIEPYRERGYKIRAERAFT